MAYVMMLSQLCGHWKYLYSVGLGVVSQTPIPGEMGSDHVSGDPGASMFIGEWWKKAMLLGHMNLSPSAVQLVPNLISLGILALAVRLNYVTGWSTAISLGTRR
jgi:hypothetical protein